MGEMLDVDLLTVEQAARRLGTSVRFVRRLVAERRVRFYKVGKFVRFHPADLAEFVSRGRVEVISPVRRRGGTGVSVYV